MVSPDRSIGGTHSRGTFGLAILHPDRLHRGARGCLLASAAIGGALARPGGGRGDADADADAVSGSPDGRPADAEAGEDQEAQARPTPVTWSDAYRSKVCAAIGFVVRREDARRCRRGQTGPAELPASERAEAYQIVALALQASNDIPTAKSWPAGEVLVGLLADSANSIGHGASQLIDGMASLDVNVMQAAGAEMDTGNGQLDQAKAALQELSLTYGPAGC